MPIQHFLGQFLITLGKVKPAFDLIRERQLWRGINRYGWFVKLFVVIAIILSFSFIKEVTDWVRILFLIDSPNSLFNTMGTLALTTLVEGSQSLNSGIMKYIIIVLSELIIFHFMQRTLEELRGTRVKTDLAAFIKAQIRMIKVVGLVWVLELLATIAISVVAGILGIPDWIETVLTFFAQCLFFGLVILDNYNEQLGLPIKKSMLYSRQYMGVALAAGTVLYLLMLVPLVGVVGGTILVSVTAVLSMEVLRQAASEVE